MTLKHFDYLDGWRGLAIGLLLIGHFFPQPGINLGTFGVNLFFVLSGWLMVRLLFVQQVPISRFYRRRISRVFPTHYIFLVMVLLWWALSAREIVWDEALKSALFVNNYFADTGPAVMPFGHIWSLAVEEHSYILLSLIALAARRKWLQPVVAIGSCCVGFVAMGIWYWMHWKGAALEFGKWPHSEVSAFGIFISGFFLLYFHRRGVPKLPLFTVPLLFVLALALHWWSVPSPVRTFVGVSLLALAVNLLGQVPAQLRSLLGFAPLRQLGLWSFSIYLWQQPFYLFTHRAGWSPWVACSVAVVVGIASYYLIEKPIRATLNRGWASA